MNPALRILWAFALLGAGWCLGGVTAAPAVPPSPPREPCPVCAPPSQVAHLERALGALVQAHRESAEAFGVVAGDCVVPGAWLDVGVVPVRDAVSRSRLTGEVVRD